MLYHNCNLYILHALELKQGKHELSPESLGGQRSSNGRLAKGDLHHCHCVITMGIGFLGSLVKLASTSKVFGTHVPSLYFENVTLGYDRHPTAHHLDAQINRGSLVALIGPNGSGKSTFYKGIVGELRPLEGHIYVNDRFAYLPQQRDIDRSFPIRVCDFVAMGLWRQIGSWRGISDGMVNQVHQALTRVGLVNFKYRPIGSLSGGQMQRTLFARLIGKRTRGTSLFGM